MGFLASAGIEIIHILGILLVAAICGLLSLWRDHGRVSDRLRALEEDWSSEKELLHNRISEHDRERKQEFKDLRDDVAQLHSDFKELKGMLEVWTNRWQQGDK